MFLQHRMAVRTDRDQFRRWINLVAFANLGYGREVVYVNVSTSKFTVHGTKIESFLITYRS